MQLNLIEEERIARVRMLHHRSAELTGRQLIFTLPFKVNGCLVTVIFYAFFV